MVEYSGASVWGLRLETWTQKPKMMHKMTSSGVQSALVLWHDIPSIKNSGDINRTVTKITSDTFFVQLEHQSLDR